MTDLDLEAIKARAQAATAGPWHIINYGEIVSANRGTVAYGLNRRHEDTLYIAGMDPETTLALVEEVKRLEGEVADLLADLAYSEWKHSETLERLTVTDDMVERADAKAREEAHKRFPKPIDAETSEPVDDWGFSECSRESFIDGAAYALSSQWTITDDMIERAANAIWYGQLPDDPNWEEQKNIARHALEAALGDDE